MHLKIDCNDRHDASGNTGTAPLHSNLRVFFKSAVIAIAAAMSAANYLSGLIACGWRVRCQT
jgi:hypothetical protein